MKATTQIIPLPDSIDSELDEAWEIEIKKRLDEVDAGLVKTIPAEQVFAQVRQMLRRRVEKLGDT